VYLCAKHLWFEDDEIPYEVRMKHLNKSYRKDLKRLEELSQYAKGLEEENLLLQKKIEVSGQDDAAKAQWFPLSSFLDKPSGRSSFAGLLPTGRKKAERPELAFDHDEIMRDAIKKYEEIVK